MSDRAARLQPSKIVRELVAGYFLRRGGQILRRPICGSFAKGAEVGTWRCFGEFSGAGLRSEGAGATFDR